MSALGGGGGLRGLSGLCGLRGLRGLRAVVGLACVFCCLVGANRVAAAPAPVAAADDADDLAFFALKPWPLVAPPARTTAQEPTSTSTTSCASPPPLRTRLPFGPGELLQFEVSVLGVRTGRVAVRVDDKTSVDGQEVVPVRARVKSDRFLAAFGDLDAGMITYLKLGSLTPLRMANRSTSREPLSSTTTTVREDAAFGPQWLAPAGPRGTRIAARLETHGEKDTVRSARHTSRGDVVDALSLVSFLRARRLEPGSHFCVDLFHRRRLWQVDVDVGAVSVVDGAAAGPRGLRLDLTVTRGSGRTRARSVGQTATVGVSADDDALPLLIRTPEGVVVRLTQRTPGRNFTRAPSPLPPPTSPKPLPPPREGRLRQDGAAGSPDNAVVR